MSIWCEGSSEKVYMAVPTTTCPVCGKVVDVTARGHIKPHIESSLPNRPVPAKKR